MKSEKLRVKSEKRKVKNQIVYSVKHLDFSLFTFHFSLLLTHAASLTLAQLATESFLHEIVQAVAQRFEINLVDYLVDEGKLEQQLGFLLAYAALAHIEEGGIVELAHGAAMGALDIVGIDFEHGLGVHAGGTRGAEVLVGLL